MTQSIIFSIYDEKANAYLPPFYLPNEQMAIRAIQDCVADTEHNFHKHAEDYTLFNIGTFDDQNAEIFSQKTPLVNCLEIKAQQHNQTEEHQTNEEG